MKTNECMKYFPNKGLKITEKMRSKAYDILLFDIYFLLLKTIKKHNFYPGIFLP